MVVGGEFYPLVVETYRFGLLQVCKIKVDLLKSIRRNNLLIFTDAEEPAATSLNKVVDV